MPRIFVTRRPSGVAVLAFRSSRSTGRFSLPRILVTMRPIRFMGRPSGIAPKWRSFPNNGSGAGRVPARQAGNAAARMRPSKSVMDMEVSSLKKKYKDKKFAAGCSRDVIQTGAERLGWTVEELMEKTILAMRSCEERVNKEMETLG